MHPSDFHPDFRATPECVRRVMGMTFREGGSAEVLLWIAANGLGSCPKDAMGDLYDAVEQTKTAIAKIATNPDAVYAPRSYGDLPIGRMYAANSSQGMWDDARSAIYRTVEGALDFDFENAHPTILMAICDRLGVGCPKLREYFERREEILAEVKSASGVDRAQAKQLFNRLTNLGSVEGWMSKMKAKARPPHADDFLIEMQYIAQQLSIRYDKLYDHIEKHPVRRKDSNPKAHMVSYILSHIENECLCAAVCYALDMGATVYSLIYDGFIASGIGKESLAAMSDAVFNDVGIRLNVKVKEFQTSIKVNMDECRFVDDRRVAHYFVDAMKDRLRMTSQGMWS